MTRDLRQYLQHPDKLFRRVRDEHGLLKLSQAAKDFHPGRGVYRSSYMNARRLAATETNIAYRTADHLRWQKMDFVVGIEIVLSNNHTIRLQPGEKTSDLPGQMRADGTPKANAVRTLTDICDTLAGRYPKDFKFTGWHPHCRCHAVTILKTEEEMARDTQRILEGKQPSEDSDNAVREFPNTFSSWATKNETRVLTGHTLPYFIKDNQGMMTGHYLDNAIWETMTKAKASGEEVQSLAENIAQQFEATCTPINFKSAASISRKVFTERSERPTSTPNDLKDTVRTTIVSDPQYIAQIVAELKSHNSFIRYKQQETPLGYTGNIVNIKTKNGIVAEIQINTARMIYAKEEPSDAKRVLGERLWNEIHKNTGLEGGLGHRYYEAYRILDPKSLEAEKILKQSLEYYSRFNS